MRTFEATRSVSDPPTWAVRQRALIDLLDGAVEPFADEYLDGDRRPLWPPEGYVGIDGFDDVHEGFHNWPLFYAIGGGEHVRELSFDIFDGIVDRFSEVETPFGHPMAVNEYEQCRDWFHQGEGNRFFYNLGLADPEHEPTVERAERFAGLYLADADANNYDGDRKLVRGPMNGSMGPEYCDYEAFDAHSYGADYGWPGHGSPFHDVPELDSIADVTDPDNEDRLFEALDERCSKGDVPHNLAITSLMANAYLHTGDDTYREWVREYTEAWMERVAENDGIVPDNVGLSGEIGEYTGGRWYGGLYGWSWAGWTYFGSAVAAATENAMLLEGGDETYLDLLRSQLEGLIDRGVWRSAGLAGETLHVPHKYGDPGDYHYRDSFVGHAEREDDGEVTRRDGWYEFKPFHTTTQPTHLWYMSQSDDDREMLRTVRGGGAYDRAEIEVAPLTTKTGGGREYAWLSYLEGEFPDYPERTMAADHAAVQESLAILRDDPEDVEDYDEDYLRHRNPLFVKGLLQLTMGAPQPLFFGGLVMARVRHFDGQRERAGLPEGVAALVEGLEPDGVTLTLVNTGGQFREVVVQAGTHGEHEFTDVARDADGGGQAASVGEKSVRVAMQPGTAITLEAGMERFANDPTYGYPWS